MNTAHLIYVDNPHKLPVNGALKKARSCLMILRISHADACIRLMKDEFILKAH